MNREQAIDLLDNLIGFVEDNHGSDYDEALKIAIKALKQQSCDDAISRQAVFETFGELLGVWGKRALMEIPSVTPHRWIPVSERLPEVDGKYLVTATIAAGGPIEYIDVRMYSNDLYKIDEFDFSNKQGVAGWYDYDGEHGYYEVDNIIAWRPLSEPYKVESEE